MTFNSNKLKGLMAENGFTNFSLAKEVGISPSYISEYKNGKRQPSVDIVNKMIKIFNLQDHSILFN